MTTSPDVIAARIAELPISEAQRLEAQAYVSAGEGFAQALLSIAHWFESSPSLKPTFHS
jgi:hypothetical protein